MATGGKGAGDDSVGMPVESPKTLPGGGGPQFHRAVFRAAQNGDGDATGGEEAGPGVVREIGESAIDHSTEKGTP